MEQTGEHRINAPREEVWRALNDAEVLEACIEGCESLTRVADNRYDANVIAKIGPVKAKFQADIQLCDLAPPASYSLDISVKGGVAGFGKGRAEVALAEAGQDTVLTYEVKGNVGGKLAQIGSRLIISAGRKMANDFFSKFSARWAEPPSEGAGVDELNV